VTIAKRHPPEARFLVVAAVLPYLLITLGPIRKEPRLMAPSVPLFCIALAAAAVLAVDRRRRLALQAATALVALFGVAYYPPLYSTASDPWNLVCKKIGSDPAAHPLVLINEPFLSGLFEKCGIPATVRGFPTVEGQFDNLLPQTEGYSVVWMIYTHNWYTDRTRRGANALTESNRFSVAKYAASPQIEIYRFQR
jgi:hypothetical protein